MSLSVNILITDNPEDAKSSVTVNGDVFADGFGSAIDALRSSAAALRDMGVSESPEEIMAGAVEYTTRKVLNEENNNTFYNYTTNIQPVIV